MLGNLSQREKLLAGVVASLVPVVILFFMFMSFLSQYKTRKQEISRLDTEISTQEMEMLEATQASMRRNFYYKLKSLPSADKRAIVEYRDWLEELIRDSGLQFKTIKNPEKTPVKHSNEFATASLVANQYKYSFKTSGTLDQIMKFCYEFKQLDLLHKIVSLNITPKSLKGRLTGDHSVNFVIEVLSLVDADEQRDFLAPKIDLPVTVADYEKSILTRNMFGPANNPPSLSLTRKSFYQDEDISIPLSGRDRDPNDELTYEIVDAGEIEGAEIEQKDSKRATFNAPPLELGEYEVKIRVTDNGFPQKSIETDCKIVVKEKPVKPPAAVVEAKPPFEHATKTKITRISSRDGVYEVKLVVQTKGESHELKVGDDFKLDDKIWVVRNIGVHSLTLEVDGKLLEFKHGDTLDSPRKETVVENPDIADVSTGTG